MLTEKNLDELIADCDIPPLLEWQRIMLLKLLNIPESVWYEQRKFARGNGYSQTMAYYDLIRFCLLEKLKLKEERMMSSDEITCKDCLQFGPCTKKGDYLHYHNSVCANFIHKNAAVALIAKPCLLCGVSIDPIGNAICEDCRDLWIKLKGLDAADRFD